MMLADTSVRLSGGDGDLTLSFSAANDEAGGYGRRLAGLLVASGEAARSRSWTDAVGADTREVSLAD